MLLTKMTNAKRAKAPQASAPPVAVAAAAACGSGSHAEAPQYGDFANHLRGRVLLICGDIVYTEMRKRDGTIVRRETGPFADESARLVALQSARQTLLSLNAGPPMQYTNRYLAADEDYPDCAAILLDAEFSEDATQPVIVNKCDLPFVLREQWGAKKLSDGKWCAVTDGDHAPAHTLHDYLQVSFGRRLVKFADGNALNCSRSNMQACPLGAPSDAIIQIDASDPKSDGKIKGLAFEKGAGTYPHGRWRLKYSVDGKATTTDKCPKNGTESEKERTKQLILAKRTQLIEIMRSQNTKTWADQHPEASLLSGVAVPLQLVPMRNTAFPSQSHTNGFHFGSHLRGRVSQHGRYKWCFKATDADHEHFDEERAAMLKLLELNSVPPYSINAWQRVEGGARKILLDGADGNAFMLVNDEPEVVEALSQHAWIAHSEGDGDSFEVRNADASSQWKRAIDVIAFQTMKTIRRSDGRAVVSTPEQYLSHWTAKLLTADHRDLRFENVGCEMY
jgi:hypothetical protein